MPWTSRTVVGLAVQRPNLPESSKMNLVVPLSWKIRSSAVVKLIVRELEAVMVVS